MKAVRLAEAADAEALADLIREVGRDLGWPVPDDPRVTRAQVARHLDSCLRQPESHSLWVAAPSGRVAGYLAVHWMPYLILPRPVGYVSELFVRPADRGAGWGTSLLAAVEEEARQRGGFRLELLNKRERESYRRGFYARSGWSEREEMAVFNRRLE